MGNEKLEGNIPVCLLDLILRCLRLDAQAVIQLRFRDHGCDALFSSLWYKRLINLDHRGGIQCCTAKHFSLAVPLCILIVVSADLGLGSMARPEQADLSGSCLCLLARASFFVRLRLQDSKTRVQMGRN
jgi:hypothetical protein